MVTSRDKPCAALAGISIRSIPRRGGMVFPVGSLGHTGFTGTTLSMDPGDGPGLASLRQWVIGHEFATRPDLVAWTPSTWSFHHPRPGLPFPEVSPDTLATCARRSILLASHRGVVPKPTTDRGNILLSESTVRTTLKITSAAAAVLAVSLAGAGTALADEIGGDASGGGDFGFGVSGPTLPSLPPPPALPAPTASASGGTGVGVDTPLGSAEGGFATDLGVGLPTLPPPPPPPPLPTASGSAQTNLGFGF